MGEQRGIAENPTEEEHAVFDPIDQPDVKLTEKESVGVRRRGAGASGHLEAGEAGARLAEAAADRAAVRLWIEQNLDRLPGGPQWLGEVAARTISELVDARSTSTVVGHHEGTTSPI